VLHRYWLCLSTVVLGLTSHSWASFENMGVARSIDLGGSLVHTTTTYNVKALEDGSNVYVFALTEKEQEMTSWMEAKVKGQSAPLSLENHGLSQDATYYYSVALPKALDKDQTAALTLETVQTHAAYPFPPEAAQNDRQALMYHTDLFVLSPYKTLVQKTKFNTPGFHIFSYTQPKEVAFTTSSIATRGTTGTTVTYGPFSDLPPSSNTAFAEKHQQKVSIHYDFGFPMLAIKDLRRTAEISHWGANLNIQDEIHLYNAGPKLKGHFSRIEHQAQAFQNRRAPHVLTELALQLPAGIHSAYFYDTIGNVSTSHLRVAPSQSQGGLPGRNSLLELRPRYPLLGGWNYSFTLGWDSSLGDYAGWDAEKGRYIVSVPIMTPFGGTVIEDAEVKVILPEASTDVEVFPPFYPSSLSSTTHTTYLDTTGRPTVVLKYRNLTDRHTGVIYVAYKVPFPAHLKKPTSVGIALFSAFFVAFLWKRVDLKLEK